MSIEEHIRVSDIENAINNDEFIFYFQPLISLYTGMICGAESLIRWKKPDGRVISPGLFIPLAEENGIITKITKHMLPKVVNAIETINQIDNSLFITFNVSAKDFADTDFVSVLNENSKNNLHKQENLWIEITETSFLPSNPDIQRVLRGIDNLGISIVLNDFTAGFTSFSTLTQLPLKAIKIALGVTQGMTSTKEVFRLFRHLVSMAHQLNLNVIAEGLRISKRIRWWLQQVVHMLKGIIILDQFLLKIFYLSSIKKSLG